MEKCLEKVNLHLNAWKTRFYDGFMSKMYVQRQKHDFFRKKVLKTPKNWTFLPLGVGVPPCSGPLPTHQHWEFGTKKYEFIEFQKKLWVANSPRVSGFWE